MTIFTCEKEREATLLQASRCAFLQTSRLGASAPSLDADSAAVHVVHLPLPEQAMGFKIVMPLPFTLTANWDRVFIVVSKKISISRERHALHDPSGPEPVSKDLQ